MNKKVNNEIENEIIVIGADHYNALGVLRSLGEVGINSNFILIGDKKRTTTIYCKYIKKIYKIKNDSEEAIIKLLQEEFNNHKLKPILIPTGDPIAKILDKNYNELSKKFILPNIDETEGMITKCMDKSYQKKLCDEYGIKVASSEVIKLNMDYKNIISKFPEKVIIKPNVSADGDKSDICIANGIQEIEEGLDKFKDKGYKEVIVQEFLNYETEYAMMGFAHKGTVIIPGINDNINIYPSNRGNTSYSRMFPVKDFEFDISKIIDMIGNIKYTGFFEVETFKVKDELYFNELNLRNSANLFAYSGNNINYIYLWILLVLGKDLSKEKLNVDKSYYFVIEHLHIKQIKEGTATVKEVISHLKKSTKLIYNKKDKKPFIMRYINAIIKRLKNEKD